jgi:Uncharacterised nucleotidyltransferase
MRNISSGHLLLVCLAQPDHFANLDLADWALVLRLARASKLQAHLYGVLRLHGLLDKVPESALNQLQAAQAVVRYRRRMALWELNRLQRALVNYTSDIIALKGCAYVLLGLPFAENRLFSDVDIMVSKAGIGDIEQRLTAQQWQALALNAYDQSYYRRWMHEIPPLRHPNRSMEVDIHHTIIPPTSACQPDPRLLMQAAITITGSRFKVLSPCDLLLHSAVHLFVDSDLSNKLRDLVDLDQLLRHFGQQDGQFYSQLLIRAEQLGLQRPLYYSLRYCYRLLATPIPVAIREASQAFTPIWPINMLMDTLVPIAILPENPDTPSRKVALARWLLFVRSHYLRMPLSLLIPHLSRKVWARLCRQGHK